MTATTAFHEVLATVRETAAAHASALDELERVFTAQTAAFSADQEALEAERGASLQRAAEASARERVLIAKEREAVDRDRADWEAKIERMAAVQPSSEDRFKLNVGGVRFEASRTTLTKVPESMLATMFGARVDMLRREVAKTIRELPTGPRREAMLLELEFFGLADAVFPPRSWLERGAEFKEAFTGGELASSVRDFERPATATTEAPFCTPPEPPVEPSSSSSPSLERELERLVTMTAKKNRRRSSALARRDNDQTKLDCWSSLRDECDGSVAALLAQAEVTNALSMLAVAAHSGARDASRRYGQAATERSDARFEHLATQGCSNAQRVAFLEGECRVESAIEASNQTAFAEELQQEPSAHASRLAIRRTSFVAAALTQDAPVTTLDLNRYFEAEAMAAEAVRGLESDQYHERAKERAAVMRIGMTLPRVANGPTTAAEEEGRSELITAYFTIEGKHEAGRVSVAMRAEAARSKDTELYNERAQERAALLRSVVTSSPSRVKKHPASKFV